MGHILTLSEEGMYDLLFVGSHSHRWIGYDAHVMKNQLIPEERPGSKQYLRYTIEMTEYW